MVGLKTLLENRGVKRFLRFVQHRGKEILDKVDLSFLNSIFQMSGKRGRPPVYKSDQTFKAVIYGYANGRHQATEIARVMEDGGARATCGYLHRTPSHDTLSRFLKKLAGVVGQVFRRLVKQLKKREITGARPRSSTEQALEPGSGPTLTPGGTGMPRKRSITGAMACCWSHVLTHTCPWQLSSPTGNT